VKSILVFGTGKAAWIATSIIDPSKAKVIAFIDNNSERHGGCFQGKTIVAPNEICHYPYDYIVIASFYNEEIARQLMEMGIDRQVLLKDLKSFLLYYKLSDFSASGKRHLGFITGKSYANYGIDTTLLKNNFFNFSFGSQDLYHDFRIVNKLHHSYPEITRHLKYALIVLEYYSFDFDLSKTRDYCRMFYRPILEPPTDVPEVEGIAFEDWTAFDRIAGNLFVDDYLNRICSMSKKVCESTFNQSRLEKIDSKAIEAFFLDGVIYRKEFNKNFPDTVLKNKTILKKYLNLLERLGIRPLVVICPQRYVREIIDPAMKNRFYEILHEIVNSRHLPIFDYFSSDLFTDDDYFDPVHLNSLGARKLTALLNRDAIVS
jgi:hypothetical protein